MKLIVGLGNPGEKYKGVRHNLGFMVVEELGKAFNNEQWTFNRKLKSEIVKSQISNVNCILAKPQTYMNNSGLAVKLLAAYYKIASEDIIVIHDDLDLSLGKIKIRLGGAAAGHHGVESVIAALGTDQFTRVRLGIGPSAGSGLALLGEHKKAHFSAEKFVLEPFIHKEKPQVKHMIKQAIKALDLIYTN